MVTWVAGLSLPLRPLLFVGIASQTPCWWWWVGVTREWVCSDLVCLQKSATEQEGREKDVKKTLALVKQRWSKSKGVC